MGSDFQKEIYQEALGIEMNNHRLSFERTYKTPIIYKGNQIGVRGMNYFVASEVVVEMIVVSEITDIHLRRAVSYLETHCEGTGLLINFGAEVLYFKQVETSQL